MFCTAADSALYLLRWVALIAFAAKCIFALKYSNASFLFMQ